ncbi:zinc finger protein 189-like [Scomber scombrus]|uniref:zinc finger protein 189-like n=1 Tax=Scomber scombrus TaxID=13677 RepID=UPI002DDC053E|nr:zinc finger protein 189-like [Scomber scombrus]
MSQIEMLRLLITQRLTEAAEEIYGVFGRIIAEYEEQISRYKIEIQRQRHLQELREKPSVCVLARQQDWSCESTPPHIKEEEEELWSTLQQEEQEQQEEELDEEEQQQEEQQQEEQQQEQQVEELDEEEQQEQQQEEQQQEELDPQLGTSVQDSPEAAGNGLLACVEPAEVVDSYICTVCGRAFAQRAHWSKHVQVHQKLGSKTDKSYTCEICGKRLTRFDGYQKHLRIHTGEKPYSCEECGRRFSDNSNYKRHIRTHAGSKTQLS